MTRRSFPLILLGIYCTLASLIGCGQMPKLGQEDGPLGIEVSLPVQRDVTDTEEFTGRLQAIYSLDVKPQVTGKLLTMPFKEGDEVKKGDLLFTIDPEQYQAQVEVGKADEELAKAKMVLAKADNKRAKAIRADNPAAISQQDLDKYDAAEKEAMAAVDSAKAKLTSYDINLKWCKIPSDINGVISKYYLTTGNLVNQNQTLLTTVLSMDPIYVYFDMDERTLLKVREAIREKKIKLTPSEDILVNVGLTSEGTAFPHKGFINFVNNKVDPNTGTITVRGQLDNPKIDDKGRRLMSPGMFARIQLPLSNPYPALLVAEKVILTDQGLKNVYVVDDENKVRYRRVNLGASQADGLRVVTGLKKTDRVAVSNLQQLRPDMEVTFDVIPMESVAKPVRGE